jgi:hypothetical protein
MRTVLSRDRNASTQRYTDEHEEPKASHAGGLLTGDSV